MPDPRGNTQGRDTFRDILLQGRDLLTQTEVSDTPYLDALILMETASGLSRERLLASLPEQVDSSIRTRFTTLLEDRASGRPIAYIIGEREFYGRTFKVDERVLIPRPDTEILVDTALEILRELNNPPGRVPEAPLQAADICCGSGCVGLTIKAESHMANIILADISDRALQVTKLNAARLLDESPKTCLSDLLADVPGTFDIIVSNPPYLSGDECCNASLRQQGEPLLALEAGEDGLDVIRRLAVQGFAKLHEKGYLIVECGYTQADAVSGIFRDAGFTSTHIVKDLAGRDRVVVGMKE